MQKLWEKNQWHSKHFLNTIIGVAFNYLHNTKKRSAFIHYVLLKIFSAVIFLPLQQQVHPIRIKNIGYMHFSGPEVAMRAGPLRV